MTSFDASLWAEQGLSIVTREEWGARYPDYAKARSVQAVADMLFLHISVTNIRPDEAEHMRYIERIGMGRFPTVGPSYNAAVFQSGNLYELQPLQRRGAHTINDKSPMPSVCPVHGGSLLYRGTGNLNFNARALVLAQNVQDEVTEAQLDAAARWGAALIKGGRVKRGAIWHGHRDVTAKACPGPIAYALIPQLQALTERYVQGSPVPVPEPTPSPEEDLMLIPPTEPTLVRLKDGTRLRVSASTEAAVAWKLGGDDDWVELIGDTPTGRAAVAYVLPGPSRYGGLAGDTRIYYTEPANVLERKPKPFVITDCAPAIAAALAEAVPIAVNRATDPLNARIAAARSAVAAANTALGG